MYVVSALITYCQISPSCNKTMVRGQKDRRNISCPLVEEWIRRILKIHLERETSVSVEAAAILMDGCPSKYLLMPHCWNCSKQSRTAIGWAPATAEEGTRAFKQCRATLTNTVKHLWRCSYRETRRKDGALVAFAFSYKQGEIYLWIVSSLCTPVGII